MIGETRRVVGLAAVVAVLLAGACADEPTRESTTPPSTTEPAVASTTIESSTSTTTTSTTTTSTTSTSTTSTPPYPTTTVHQVPDDCDVDGMLAAIDAVVAMAGLAPAAAWSTEGTAIFDERTNDAEEFRDRLGLDCRLRAVESSDVRDRLVLAAWTGARHAFVVQSSDGPASPFAPDQRLQLLYEQPYGEWLVDQEIWAGTLDGGETVIVAVDDYSLGATAKAWQALPRWEDLPISIDTERYAIDVLLHAGARNVSPGEDPAFGSTIAAIQFVTPSGLPLIATVAPAGDFDPAAPIVEGERTTLAVDGVEVIATTGAADSYAVGSVGWACGDHVWFVDSVWGTVDELLDWASTLIVAGACAS